MITKGFLMGISFFVIISLANSGCETYGGSIIGPATGLTIGRQLNRGREGFIIGLATGIIVAEQQQLATRQEVEQEYFRETGKELTEPTATWEGFAVMPKRVRPGHKLTASGKYVIAGPEASPRKGYLYIIQGGERIDEGELEDIREGKWLFEMDFNIPDSLPDGEYDLVVEIINGTKTAKETESFVVARS